jgi:hypothetical protein
MTQLPQVDLKLPAGFQVSSIIATPIPDEKTFPLRLDQFQILTSDMNSDAKSSMYFCLGLFVSSLLGLFGLFENADWPGFWAHQRGLLLACFAGMLAIAAGSLFGFLICLYLLKKKNTPYTALEEKIANHFSSSVEVQTSKVPQNELEPQ